MALRGKQQRFVDEYLIDRNGAQAYLRAGYKAKNEGVAAVMASRLLRNDNVKKAIEAGEAELAERNKITQDKVLKRLWEMAQADPNELQRFIRVNCRYCWGTDHEYQWTKGEYQAAVHQAQKLEMAHPACIGGLGFDKIKAPNADCPECRGLGVGYTYIADTTQVSPQAKLIYAGVKETQHGIEIKMHDQLSALIKAGQHIGMFKDRVELGNDPDNPLTDPKAASKKLSALAKLVKANKEKKNA